MPEFVNRNSQMRSNCSSRKRYPQGISVFTLSRCAQRSF
jgi:hypothetical protein